MLNKIYFRVIVLLILFIFIYFSYFYADFYDYQIKSLFPENGDEIRHYFKYNSKLIEPECKCSSALLIERVRNKSFISINSLNVEIPSNKKIIRNLFNLSLKELRLFNIACDLHNALRRGKHQKIVSYSLYGLDRKYYLRIERIIEQIKLFYNGYSIRIYHDASINRTFKCYLECKYPELVDFCDINRFGSSLRQALDENEMIDLGYMHKMMWRFLPIGDSLVDWFLSRDTDSFIIEREQKAVEQWLRTASLAHVMRDKDGHSTEILGGLWGFRNQIDRDLSKELFDLVTSTKIARKYNRDGTSPKGNDQSFLSRHVYTKIWRKSIIHDSYYCRQFPNSVAFPTRRNGTSYVGNLLEQETEPPKECPIECRPEDHNDWTFC